MSGYLKLPDRQTNGVAPSRNLANGTSKGCAGCGNAFRVINGHIEAYRSGNFYFCSKFCAESYQDHRHKGL